MPLRHLTEDERLDLIGALRNLVANAHLLPFDKDRVVDALPLRETIRYLEQDREMMLGPSALDHVGMALYLFALELFDADAPRDEISEVVRAFTLFETDPEPTPPWLYYKDKKPVREAVALVGQPHDLYRSLAHASTNARLKDVAKLSHAEGATLERLLHRLAKDAEVLDDSVVTHTPFIRPNERDIYCRFLSVCRTFSHQENNRKAVWIQALREDLDAAYKTLRRDARRRD